MYLESLLGCTVDLVSRGAVIEELKEGIYGDRKPLFTLTLNSSPLEGEVGFRVIICLLWYHSCGLCWSPKTTQRVKMVHRRR